MTYATEYKITKTRFATLGLMRVTATNWRFCDVSEDRPAVVGPHYATKTEALADLDRYAREYGLEA